MRIATVWCVLCLSACAYGITREDNHRDSDRSLSTGGGGAGGASASSSSVASVSSTAASSVVSSTSSGMGCDGHGDCAGCMNCSVGNECATEANNCLADQDCADFLDCIQPCMDQTCMDACAQQHPSGFNLYMILTECAMCDACPVDCAVEGMGLCT